MDNLICKMLEGTEVTFEEQKLVLEHVKARIANGEQGDDIPIAMEALGCNYTDAVEAVSSRDKDAAIALLNAVEVKISAVSCAKSISMSERTLQSKPSGIMEAWHGSPDKPHPSEHIAGVDDSEQEENSMRSSLLSYGM